MHTHTCAANLTVSDAKGTPLAAYIVPGAGIVLVILAIIAGVIAVLVRLHASRKRHIYEDIQAAGNGMCA